MMTEGFAPVDIEGALVAYLAPIVGCRVVTTIPNPRPDQLVRVGRIGGVASSLVQDSPIVLVEAWGMTETEAFDLAADVSIALTAGVGSYITPGVWLYSADTSGFVNYPDPASSGSRYQLTANLNTRRKARPL